MGDSSHFMGAFFPFLPSPYSLTTWKRGRKEKEMELLQEKKTGISDECTALANWRYIF